MKKLTTYPVQAHLLRGAFYLLLLLAVCASPFALAQRNATKPKRGQVRQREERIGESGRALRANIIVVTNTNDSGPGSLRQALADANDGDTIDATGVAGTILLTSGELQINHSVTINGPGAGNLAVNGNATFRVFENFASNATISAFTITNGNVSDVNGGGGILNHGGLIVSHSIVSNSSAHTDEDPGGGGISNISGATLTVTSSTITGNDAACEGGGIYSSDAQLTVINSIISGNGAGSRTCGGDGGGIFHNGVGTVTVMNSVISGNQAISGGGMVIQGGAAAMVTDSTISDNIASFGFCSLCSIYGGGIINDGSNLTVTNSTISGNEAFGGFSGAGGGIVNSGSLTVTNSTISDNIADGGHGGYGGGIDNGGNLALTNSTLSENSASPDQGGSVGNFGTTMINNTVMNNFGGSGGTISNNGGTVTSLGYNLASDDGGGVLTGPGDQINTDPMLGPLQDNGGPTFTHALLPGSPAFDAGDPNFTPPPIFDQRGPGFDRVVNGRIDIGSFEVQAGPTPTPTPTPTCTPAPTPCDSLWTERTPVPYHAAGIFAVSDGTYVYAGGGADVTNNIFYNDLLQYDPGNDSWTPLVPSPDAHGLSQAVYFNGKIYSIGGWVSGSATTDLTRIYDTSAKTWSTGAPMPQAIGSMATALWNGVIYVAGGYIPGIGVIDTLYAYDIATDTWTTLASMPQALNYPGFGVIDGKLYIAGGTSTCCLLATLYIYDIATNTWTNGANLPHAMRGPGCTILDGKLYLYGGQLFAATTNTTLVYDPCSDTWSNGPDMQIGRSFLYGTATGNNSIVAPGGVDVNLIALDDNEQLINTQCATPTPTPTVTPTPTPTATATPRATPRPRPTPHPRPSPP